MTPHGRSAMPSGRTRDAAVLAGLAALAAFYVASFAFLAWQSRDFIMRQRRERPVAYPFEWRLGEDLPLAGPKACVRCLIAGWHEAEAGFVWTRDEDAELRTPPLRTEPQDGRDFVLVVNAAGFFSPRRPVRSLQPVVNGTALAPVTLELADPRQGPFFWGSPYEHHFALPRSVAGSTESLAIVLRSDPPGVPAEFYKSTDRRALGLAVRSLRVELAEGRP